MEAKNKKQLSKDIEDIIDSFVAMQGELDEFKEHIGDAESSVGTLWTAHESANELLAKLDSVEEMQDEIGELKAYIDDADSAVNTLWTSYEYVTELLEKLETLAYKTLKEVTAE